MLKTIRGMAAGLLAAIATFSISTAYADPTVTYSKWLEEVKYSGDIRIRHQDFRKKTAGQVDRTR